MNEMLILGGIVALLCVALVWLRVPSSIAFLSLLIGQLLSSEASDDVYGFVGSLLKISEVQYIQAALLLLPLLLTLLLMRGRVAKSKVFIEIVPMLLLSALTVVLVVPLLTELNVLLSDATKDQIDDYRSLIVAAASISALLSAWLNYPKQHGKGHKKHKL